MCRDLKLLMRQGNDDLLPVRPLSERQHFLESFPSHDNGIDSGCEFLVPVSVFRAAATRSGKPVQIAVFPGDEAVKARSYEDGYFQKSSCLILTVLSAGSVCARVLIAPKL